MNKTDRAIYIRKDKEWIPSQFSEIKKGDIFRMFESDTGNQFVDAKGRSEFVALSDVRINEDGKWAVDVGC